MQHIRGHDRGASAVEFALVAPVFIAMILSVIAFGHAFFVQSVLSNAARDGVRVMALQDTSNNRDPVAEAKKRAVASAAPGVIISENQVSVMPANCEAVDTSGPLTATVTIKYPMQLLGRVGQITLTGKGTMRCNG
ncbi:TadE/TadG family type IV pilus assembly protein [Tessaracoccus oleiagri]|uniref:TadE-like protein n=1 Tax=Tessaracoccus oleiagri TaxID=686624 RepID=A0A1G9MI05_9ACTN|nr:TadE family protein [Tessaracoccus oleiagri]SDL73651.1 TadE-like protein [Tessaracoccus oleiagri]